MLVFLSFRYMGCRQPRRTYTAATSTTSTSTTATARTTATASRLAAACAFTTGTLSSTLALLVRLGLASELDGNLALKDLLARQLSDGTLSLAGSREVDKGVTDRTVGARVLRDRNRLTEAPDAWLARLGRNTMSHARNRCDSDSNNHCVEMQEKESDDKTMHREEVTTSSSRGLAQGGGS
jgi:hypothetical protein